jgi:hypothetical protein
MYTRILLSHRARRLFIIIHLWLGLFLGAWFSLIGVTGSVLAWRGELNGWEMSRRYPIQKPSPDARMIPFSQVVAVATRPQPTRRHRPDGNGSPPISDTRVAFTPGSTSGAAGGGSGAAVSIGIPNSKMPFYTIGGGRRQRLSTLIDPYSGREYQAVDMRSTWTFTM